MHYDPPAFKGLGLRVVNSSATKRSISTVEGFEVCGLEV